MKRLLCLLCLFSWQVLAQPYSETGLPLPRFVSLKSDEVNMRKGPGTRYPIHWIYKREGLPVEIINEFGHWRQIRDHEGMTGWMHKSMLSGKRMIMVRHDKQLLRRDADENASALLAVMSGVLGDLVECSANWCEIQIKSRKGWVQKAEIWGVYPQEIIE